MTRFMADYAISGRHFLLAVGYRLPMFMERQPRTTKKPPTRLTKNNIKGQCTYLKTVTGGKPQRTALRSSKNVKADS